MNIIVKSFQELSKDELYELLNARTEIFVVEQECPYQEVDYMDQKALHILGKEEGELIAYCRAFKGGDHMKEASIGRVLVKQEHRKRGLGKVIMEASMDAVRSAFKTNTMAVSAQQYLRQFYNELGFSEVGEPYLEDDIPHIKMVYSEN
ncbi:MAG: GNAT family N-acetyltransferase [Eudoraea sp.]|nr:GNAT family N-acetyltransferase [Eudoraea sp.]